MSFMLSSYYEKWNCALYHYFFDKVSRGDMIYLSLDQSTRDEVLKKICNAEEIEFVWDQICRFVGRNNWSCFLNRNSCNDIPDSLGLIGLQIYAAYQMGTEGEYTDRAYLPRIEKMIHVDRNRLENVLFPNSQEALWNGFQKWVERRQMVFSIPSRKKGPGRYVQYPLSHAFLTKDDVLKLHCFFADQKLDPGQEVSVCTMKSFLSNIGQSISCFSHRAKKALEKSETKNVFYRQILHEFYKWDGIAPQGYLSKRHVPVQLDKSFRPNLSIQLYPAWDEDYPQRCPECVKFQICEGNEIREIISKKDCLDFLNNGDKHGFSPFSNNGCVSFQQDAYGWTESKAWQKGDWVLFVGDRKNDLWKRVSRFDNIFSKQVEKNSREQLSKDIEMYQWDDLDAFFNKEYVLCIFKAVETESMSVFFSFLQGGIKLSRKVWMKDAGPELEAPEDIEVRLIGCGKQEKLNEKEYSLVSLPSGKYKLYGDITPVEFEITEPEWNEQGPLCGWDYKTWSPSSIAINQSGMYVSTEKRKTNDNVGVVRFWCDAVTGQGDKKQDQNIPAVVNAMRRGKHGVRI